jgi:hypothetical protein
MHDILVGRRRQPISVASNFLLLFRFIYDISALYVDLLLTIDLYITKFLEARRMFPVLAWFVELKTVSSYAARNNLN